MRCTVLLFALAAGCGPSALGPGGGGDDDGHGTPDAGGVNPNGPDAGSTATQPCDKMDIVFVVDDSGSMSEEQDNLATNFPMFATVLDTYTTSVGSKLDYHVAVTTTGRDLSYTQVISQPPLPPVSLPANEPGDNGAFRDACGVNRRWLERTDPNVADALACRAKVGTGGPSLEMPIYTTELAFRDRMQDMTNSGFLRDDALLAIVIITDEDDCSRTDNNFTVQVPADDPCHGNPTNLSAADYKDFLDQVKGPGRWAAAVIAGPSDCSSAFGSAVQASKLQEFVSLAGANGVFGSICDGDLAPSLSQALATFQSACESFPNPQ